MSNTLTFPNTTTGEFCPDWPDACVCPIEPPHQQLPSLQADCGHCSKYKVTVPQAPMTPTDPSTTDLLMAGAYHCARCNTVLCNNCGEEDQNQTDYACANQA